MKIKHYSLFKSDMQVLDWNQLRENPEEMPYYLPFNSEDYIKKANEYVEKKYVTKIINCILKEHYNKVFSIGAGVACLEYAIKTNSNLFVGVSDFTESIERLKKFDVFDEAIKLDIIKDKLPFDSKSILLMSRIDTEFSDEQLLLLFEKLKNTGIKNIIFIPAQKISMKLILIEIKKRVISLLKRKKLVFCGYSRSMGSFKKIFGNYYKLKYTIDKKNDIYLLELKTYIEK